MARMLPLIPLRKQGCSSNPLSRKEYLARSRSPLLRLTKDSLPFCKELFFIQLHNIRCAELRFSPASATVRDPCY
jgi:hypothetical protein